MVYLCRVKDILNPKLGSAIRVQALGSLQTFLDISCLGKWGIGVASQT